MCFRHANPRAHGRPYLSGLWPHGHAQVHPHQPALFLFCGRHKDRIKGLLWDETGFLLLYKRLEDGRYQWPDEPKDLLEISEQQLRWLTEGLTISPSRLVRKVHPQFMAELLAK